MLQRAGEYFRKKPAHVQMMKSTTASTCIADRLDILFFFSPSRAPGGVSQ